MKEYQLWRARMICRGAGRGKHDYLPPARESLQRTQTRASRSWCVLHGRRVPIIDFPRTRASQSVPWRRSALGDGRPYFSGRFRTHAVYHWPPAEKGGPAPYTRPVFILMLGTRLRIFCRSHSLAHARSPPPPERHTLAALWTHRIPGRWSHWTRSPFIFLFRLVWIFFPRSRSRTHTYDQPE